MLSLSPLARGEEGDHYKMNHLWKYILPLWLCKVGLIITAALSVQCPSDINWGGLPFALQASFVVPYLCCFQSWSLKDNDNYCCINWAQLYFAMFHFSELWSDVGKDVLNAFGENSVNHIYKNRPSLHTIKILTSGTWALHPVAMRSDTCGSGIKVHLISQQFTNLKQFD